MTYSADLPYLADATAYYAAIADLPWPVWLDSNGRGRYDILCAQPVATLQSRGDRTEVITSSGAQYSREDPFLLVRQQMGEVSAGEPGVPFAGGALGYWGYDLARRLMPLPVLAADAERLPEMAVGIYDWALVIDHQQQSARLLSHLRHAASAEQLPLILARLQAAEQAGVPQFQVHGRIVSNFTRAQYGEAFARVQAYLQAGDCYQINLAQRFSASASGDAFGAYLTLR